MLVICADDKPWSEKQPSNDDNDDDDDDDDDDYRDPVDNTDYEQRRGETGDSDAFDYVRVQLPFGGHGDNIAKSHLTVNQV